ncbi:MAG: HEAT repeat domain-containing protein, partial [Thermoanaerobaculia bacterium]|nr:HEAT repeat domain-containing protein [Thermoanaerobaculia bacterium]
MTDAPDLKGFAEANRPIVEALRSNDRELHDEVLDSLAYLLDDELAKEVVRILRGDGPEEFRAELALALGPTLELQRSLELDPRVAAGSVETDGVEMSEADLTTGGFEVASQSIDDEAFLSKEGMAQLVRALESVFRDGAVPAVVRRAVLEAAVRDPQPWHEGAVRAAWASEDPHWKLTAVYCMGLLGEVDFAKEVAEACRAAYPELRREAIVAAGNRRMQALFPDLVRLAASHDADEELRIAAISAVGMIGGPGAAEVLQATATSGRPALAAAALEASHKLL